MHISQENIFIVTLSPTSANWPWEIFRCFKVHVIDHQWPEKTPWHRSSEIKSHHSLFLDQLLWERWSLFFSLLSKQLSQRTLDLNINPSTAPHKHLCYWSIASLFCDLLLDMIVIENVWHWRQLSCMKGKFFGVKILLTLMLFQDFMCSTKNIFIPKLYFIEDF